MNTTQRPKYATSVRQKFLVIFIVAGGLWGLHYLSPPADPIVIRLVPAGGKRLPSVPAQGGVPAGAPLAPPRG